MSISTFAPTSLTLAGSSANEVVLSAPSNSTLFLSGDTAGGVDLVGVNNLTCSTAFNQGTSALAGLCTGFGGGVSTATAGLYMAYGNGGTGLTNGFMMPVEGTVVRWSVMADASITATFELIINGAATGVTISLSAARTNDVIINHAFSAGDDITSLCTAGPGTNSWTMYLFVRFGS